ncbi:MAG: histidine kinase [Chitinophagaceae bacterium]|nr:histidine kinase [Chitinophagaceae bacterium]
MIFKLAEVNRNLTAGYSFTNYNNIDNIGNNYIYSIYKDSKDRIWFGTDGKGITVLENGKFSRIDKETGLKDDHIYSFTEDLDGNIWFNTEGAGIYRFDGKTFRNYSLAEGISDLKIIALKTGPLGNIVLVQRKGLDILDIRNGTVSYLDNKQGIPEVNTDAGSVTQDSMGNIILSTSNGILVYTPVENTIHYPKTVIENVQLFLTDINKEVPGSFNYDQNSFLFNFTGIYYTNPDEVHYQYKLEGLDTAWIPTRDRSVSFLRLQPGTYRFHVRSSLSENFEGAHEATYVFVISKPIWKRYWFIILCILAGGGLIYWYMKSREKQFRKMQQLQQEKIQFQFQVLRNQVNPHFLFNSFNTLISTIEDDPAMAVGYVEQLSGFFRNIVNYRDKDIISLGEEISVVQTYFYLQQKRYGNNLALEVDITDEMKRNTFIPPLTLQLLVENAIKHNAVSKESPLAISIFVEDEKALVIRNNINPKMTGESGAGMGLQNIVNRYNLLSREPVTVNNDGKTFTVILPLLKQYDNENTDH